MRGHRPSTSLRTNGPPAGRALRAACCAAALALAAGCIDLFECQTETLTDVASPDRRHRAVVFQRDCGATTGHSTQLSLLRGGSALPDSGGNVLVAVAVADSGAAPAAPGRGPAVAVRSLSAATLEVRYDARARVAASEPRVDGIDVRLVPVAGGRP